jgi:hypothetical protein
MSFFDLVPAIGAFFYLVNPCSNLKIPQRKPLSMVDSTDIQVPDITPSSAAEFLIEFLKSDKKPVATTAFNYSVDKGKTLSGETDGNGVLKVKVKTPPPREIALSLPA